MRDDDERLTAVIPAWNEGNTIAGVVTDVAKYTDEVIVVDDCSTDRTGEKARQAGATVIQHETNRGYDESIEDGFSLAVEHGATIVFTFDADGQHIAEDVPRVVEPIRATRADVVVGQRPTKARLTERLFALYTSCRLSVADPLCGFKAYRTSLYRAVGHFDDRSTIGTKLLLEAKKRGYRIEQVPIQLDKREDESRFGQQLEANWKITKALGRLIWFDLLTKVSPR